LVHKELVHAEAALVVVDFSVGTRSGGSHYRESPVGSQVTAKSIKEKESIMRVLAFTLVLVLGSLGLAACTDVEIETEDEKRFTIFSIAGTPQPILLNQETGESWQLTDSGWQRIREVVKNGKVIDWENPDD
jgi:hypothetical protein